MTVEELKKVMHILGLDYEAEANQIYVFFVSSDGRVDNFSINVKFGSSMSDADIIGLMNKQYPSTRGKQVVAIDRSNDELDDMSLSFRTGEYKELEDYGSRQESGKVYTEDEWMDIPDVCKMLKISRRTLQRWTERGLFVQSRIGGRIYYSRTDIIRVIERNVVQENGRIDQSELESTPHRTPCDNT